LTGGSRGGCSGRSHRITGSSTIGKAPPYLLCRVKFAPTKSSGPRNRRTRPTILRALLLEYPKHVFRAVGGPYGNKLPVVLA